MIEQRYTQIIKKVYERFERNERAQQDKKYSGRKKINVSVPLFHKLSEKSDRNEITVDDAVEALNISRRTFYRRLKELNKS